MGRLVRFILGAPANEPLILPGGLYFNPDARTVIPNRPNLPQAQTQARRETRPARVQARREPPPVQPQVQRRTPQETRPARVQARREPPPVQPQVQQRTPQQRQEARHQQPSTCQKTPQSPKSILSTGSSESFTEGYRRPSPAERLVEIELARRLVPCKRQERSLPESESPKPESLEMAETVNLTRVQARKMAEEQENYIRQNCESKGIPIPEYKFFWAIGKGSYGIVYLAKDLRDGFQGLVAIKVISIDETDYKVNPRAKDESLKDLELEVKVLRQLEGTKAENVNMILDVVPIHSQIWIVSEYCTGGSVHTLMQATGNKLEEQYIRVVARETAKGLRAVHNSEIMHRDVKAANIMINEDGSVQLIDFGVAGYLESKSDKRTTRIGTPYFMMNSVWNEKAYGIEADTYSYACTIVEMAQGRPPYQGFALGRPLETQRKRKAFRLQEEKGHSKELCDFVAFVLKENSDELPSMEAILEHPFLLDTEDPYPKSILADLVKRYKSWESEGGQRMSLLNPYGAEVPAFIENPGSRDSNFRFSIVDTQETIMQQFSEVSFDQRPDDPASVRVNPATELSLAQKSEGTSAKSFDHLTQTTTDEAYLLQPSVYTPLASPRFHSNMADQVHDTMAGQAHSDMADYVKSDSAPGPSSVIAQDPAKNEQAKRGEKHFEGLFDKNKPAYKYGPHSDLPLRNQNTEASQVQRKELDATITSSASSTNTPNIDLANVDQIKEKKMKARDTMAWEMPVQWGKPEAPSTPSEGPFTLPGHSDPAEVGYYDENGYFDFGSPGEEIGESSYRQEYQPPPDFPAARPPLRHAETAPVFHAQPGIALSSANSVDGDIPSPTLSRASRFDMDAFMEMGETSHPQSYDAGIFGSAGNEENDITAGATESHGALVVEPADYGENLMGGAAAYRQSAARAESVESLDDRNEWLSAEPVASRRLPPGYSLENESLDGRTDTYGLNAFTLKSANNVQWMVGDSAASGPSGSAVQSADNGEWITGGVTAYSSPAPVFDSAQNVENFIGGAMAYSSDLDVVSPRMQSFEDWERNRSNYNSDGTGNRTPDTEWAMPIPIPPSAEAMADGAPDSVVAAEFVRQLQQLEQALAGSQRHWGQLARKLKAEDEAKRQEKERRENEDHAGNGTGRN